MTAQPLTQRAASQPMSAQIFIRPHIASDLGPLREIWSDLEVMRWMAVSPMTDQQASDTFARMMSPDQFSRRSFRFAVVQCHDQRVIGTISIDCERFSSAYAHSMVMHRDTWRRGLATEALGLVVRFGFENLNAHRIWTACETRNEAAKRLIARVGFTWFGRIPDYYQKEGVWGSVDAYSYIEDDWRARSAC